MSRVIDDEHVQVNVKPGKIYILRNPSYKDTLVKIGRTSGLSEARAKQISSVTGVPQNFEVLYEEDVVDCTLAEKLIHQKLENYRVNTKREFFQLPLKLAVKQVFEVCLFVNQGILSEVSRLVIYTSASEAQELRDLLVPYSSEQGTTAVCIIYQNNNSSVHLQLSKRWMINCDAELLSGLKQKAWVDELALVSKCPR